MGKTLTQVNRIGKKQCGGDQVGCLYQPGSISPATYTHYKDQLELGLVLINPSPSADTY